VREPTSRRSSWGRVLIFVYAVFAVAATGRSSYQLATQAGEAPFPYALSALAAVVYVAATLGLAREGDGWRKVAWAACATELAGVLVVGTLSVVDDQLFPDDTVWSAYGAGYGFFPLVLPFAGLAWLWRARVEPPG
jgi:drug/metabolite transporter (DMT)-like permease